MHITVKFFIFDLPPGFADAEMEMPEHSTVGDVMDRCLELFKERLVSMDENEFRTATVLVNGKWLDIHSEVSDGDALTVIRTLDGG